MKRSGYDGELRYLSIICMLLIIITQCPISGNGSQYQEKKQNITSEFTKSTLSESPPALSAAAMAYDAESDRVVLFGGVIGYFYWTNETWSFDYNSNTWMNMTPPNLPVGRSNHQMVYDSESDLIIMYGGAYEVGPMRYYLNDTWTYDLNSNTWTQMFPQVSPGQASDHAMTYDSRTDLVIFFRGNETWTYDVDTNVWEEVFPEPNIGHRYFSKMVYDEKSELNILYGGATWAFYYDTWIYNSTSNIWTDMIPSNNATPSNDPMAYEIYSLAFDSNAERVILFKIYEGPETWSYFYETNTWSNMEPKNHPSPQRMFCMAYDSESARTILFSDSSETWTYSYEDNTWTNMAWLSDDGTFCFIAYGDTRGDWGESVSTIHQEIVGNYVQHDPEFVIHTGDMVRQGAQLYQWSDFNNSISTLRALNIPIYGTPGNHEVYTEDESPPDEDLINYQNFFDYSDVVDQSGETELHYSFNANGIHFIFLDTVHGWGNDTYICPNEQMEWLMNDLAGNYDFIIVSFHYPLWSILAERPDRWEQAACIRSAFHSLFVEHGVDIVFNGHDHQYYHTLRDGIHYVVTGGGGAPLAEIQTEGTVWQTGDVGFSDYHYCVASVEDELLNVEVFLLNGTIADTFNLNLPVVTDSTVTNSTVTDSPEIIQGIIIISSVALVLVVIAVVWIKTKNE